MGAGSWGTTLAKVFADAGSTVTIWARRPQIADTINTHHHNPDYLPGIQLPTPLPATTNPNHALRKTPTSHNNHPSLLRGKITTNYPSP